MNRPEWCKHYNAVKITSLCELFGSMCKTFLEHFIICTREQCSWSVFYITQLHNFTFTMKWILTAPLISRLLLLTLICQGRNWDSLEFRERTKTMYDVMKLFTSSINFLLKDSHRIHWMKRFNILSERGFHRTSILICRLWILKYTYIFTVWSESSLDQIS